MSLSTADARVTCNSAVFPSREALAASADLPTKYPDLSLIFTLILYTLQHCLMETAK
jgi:hypothetical protein